MRLIILGTGGWANTHAMNFSEIADVKIVAAVDTDEVRLRASRSGMVSHLLSRRLMTPLPGESLTP